MACVSRVQCFNYLVLMMSVILPTALAAAISSSNMSLPNCPDKCGNITIPYPFGIGFGCYRDVGFSITCNDSTTPPKAFLGSGNIELLDINITSGQSRVYNVIDSRCFNASNQVADNNLNSYIINFEPPYLFSNRYNKFTVIGCDTLAYINGTGSKNNYMSGCASFCGDLNSTSVGNGTCDGLGCCQTAIPGGLHYYGVEWGYYNNSAWYYNPCMYAMLVAEDWYKFRVDDLIGYNLLESLDGRRMVPIILDWAIRDHGTCLDSEVHNGNSACLSEYSSCYNTSNGEGYLCKCSNGYDGSPYIPGGCKDIDECSDWEQYPCYGICNNTLGGFECLCEKGTTGNASITNCTKIPEKFPYPARVATASIGGIAVLVVLCFLLATYRQHKKHKKEKEEYQRYYEMMDNHLRVFSKKQIEISTNNFGNILGTGGQGNVYKGLLENNKVVAIKKAKEVEETQRGEFVNEIILLSQLNHKNIVRLLGCCLEVKIPMLVYEFVPYGTVFDLLHNKSSRRPISLSTRLKIALESAVALEYLHSAIAHSIIHGDVKAANILLDVDYTAKVSDFGASSVVPVNEIVELVHFSYGYLDPECLYTVYTHMITKSSDVYSFGVVLLELVTRKEAIYVDAKGEKQSLVTCFLLKAKRNEQNEMLDAEIVSNDKNVTEILDEICEIAVQCLSPKGEDRPTMRHVAEELHKLVRFHNRPASQQIDQEEMESLLGQTDFFSMSHASGFHSTQSSAVLEISTGAPR